MDAISTTRHRSEATTDPKVTSSWTWNNYVDGVHWNPPRYWGPYPVINFSRADTSNVTDDVEVQSFHKRKARGEIIVNDYRNVKTLVYHSDNDLREYSVFRDPTGKIRDDTDNRWNSFPGYWLTGFGDSTMTPITIAPPSIDNMIDAAMTQAMSAAKRSPTLSLVTFAELNKTASSVTTGVANLFRANQWMQKRTSKQRNLLFRLLPYGRRRRHLPKALAAAGITAGMANQWLSYRYGISQSYYDIMGLVSAMRSLKKAPRVRFSGRETWQDDTRVDRDYSPQPTAWMSRVGIVNAKKIVVDAGVLVSPLLEGYQAIHAYGLDQFLSSAWELTKYSFIIDWFLDVGDKIAALSPSAGMTVLGTWAVVRETNILEYNILDVMPRRNPNWYGGSVLQYFSGFNTSTSWSSELITTRYANVPVSVIPNWDVRLNVTRLVDLLALLRRSIGV